MKYRRVEAGEVYEEGDEWKLPPYWERLWETKWMAVPEFLLGTKVTKEQYKKNIRRKK